MDERVVRVTCTHDCPDACSALVTVDAAGRAVSIGADSSHPVTGRHLCVKVDRYLERVYDPNRLLTPLRRTGPKGSGGYEAVSWDRALDEIVDRWTTIRGESGPEAILGYSYLGSMGVLDAFGTTQALFNRLGATQLERSICGPQWFALSGLTHAAWSDPENLPDARLIVVWGMDPVSTSIHTWELIRKARKTGARMVVIDPYRSRTARYADVHLRPHAGTDGALALAMANVIITEGLADTEYISERTTGIEAYQASVADWTPERAAAETGVAADDIAALAREYASARPAAVRLGVGMQRSTGAGAALRAIQCLTELTGQRRWPAGGIASAESIGQLNLPALSRPDLVPPGTREVNMIQLGRVLTDRGLDPPIRSLFVWNSNPAVIAADQQRVIAGLRRDDLFTVVHDLFLTDTARHADIVLPATSMLEHPDLVGSWGFWYVSWNEAAIEPVGESKSNAEVARLLASHLGLDDDVFGLDDHQLMELAIADSRASHGGMQPDQLRDEGFIRVGPRPDAPAHDESTFAFEDDRLLDVGMNPVVDYVPPANRPGVANGHTLRLLTLKRHYSINTSYGNLPVMLNAEPDAIVEIHPDDAARRRIGDGDDVRIYNDLGSIRARADITDRTPAGTVGVPFGRWNHDPASGGVNSLTSDALGDLANGPTFCDNLVEVELVDGPR